MNEMMQVKVLFVCLGNICRSPTAEAVFRQKIESRGLSNSIVCDSAGTADWHIGKKPDNRSISHAENRGYNMSILRARQVSLNDFGFFDYIFAMDENNLRYLKSIMPESFSGHLDLILNLEKSIGYTNVPDPYYEGEQGFELVLDLVEATSATLIDKILSEHDFDRAD